MRRLARVAITVAVLAGALATAPARADHMTLFCAAGEVYGQGAVEHRVLQNELYIPEHENECVDVAGSITFDAAPQADAVLDFQNRRTMFLGTTEPLKRDEWAWAVTSRNNPLVRLSTLHHLPLFIGGFAVTANTGACSSMVPGGVKLGPVSLSAIYSGVATTWGDATIVKDNPSLALCTERIEVSVRDGATWSTATLKDYIAKGSPAFSPYKERELLASWPPTLGVSCRAFDDLGMRTCGLHAGAISYMPYKIAKAAGLPIALMETSSRPPQWKHPAEDPVNHSWPSNCPDAVPTGLNYPQTLGDWSTFSMTYSAAGYPICAFGYTLAFQTPYAANNAWSTFQTRNLKDHLRVMFSSRMQDALPARGYAPLPDHAYSSSSGAVESIVIPT
ncbi:MAG TPA: hypothetical protein VF230_06940 [Acidimicrobiales bacterium]